MARESGIKSTGQCLHEWFQQPLGRQLSDLEQTYINQLLVNLFGYHIVQLGFTVSEDLLAHSRISHKVILQLQDNGAIEQAAGLVCDSEFLPFAADSVDVILAPHVLEFTANPHKLLREIERILIGEGHLVLIGFNPWSLFGIWRLVLAWWEEPPWCGHFYGMSRLNDWLSLLDFELVRVQKFFYRPPLRKLRFLEKLKFLEKLGKFCWSYFGGAYLIVARKRIIPLTPTKLEWRTRRSMIASGVAEPTA